MIWGIVWLLLRFLSRRVARGRSSLIQFLLVAQVPHIAIPVAHLFQVVRLQVVRLQVVRVPRAPRTVALVVFQAVRHVVVHHPLVAVLFRQTVLVVLLAMKICFLIEAHMNLFRKDNICH
jgi:hypothetical protein